MQPDDTINHGLYRFCIVTRYLTSPSLIPRYSYSTNRSISVFVIFEFSACTRRSVYALANPTYIYRERDGIRFTEPFR